MSAIHSLNDRPQTLEPLTDGKRSNVWVVVPTYNERDNLAALLPELLQTRPRVNVVVVDDGSPDGTGEWVRRLGERCPRIHLLQRGARKGYASAVQDGLRMGLAAGASLLVHMDADFSHDPAVIPTLVDLVASRCHVAIGSRYVAGGGTQNWSLFRRLLSAGANALARFLLGVPTRDCTGGFRCYRRSVVEDAGLLDLGIEGYSFLVASVYFVHRGGWRVCETPILFVDRQWGRSKLSGRVILEAVFVTARLALRRLDPSSGATLFAAGSGPECL